MQRLFYYLLSSNLRLLVRRIYFFPIDLLDAVLGRREKGIPPKGLIFVGAGNFKEIGEKFLDYFIKLTGLQPTHRVLDVGCGIGRMAIPLTKYLNDKGSYVGFDIVKKGIKWCKKHITAENPNFTFHHADIHNKLYNSCGKVKAEQYVFPCKNEEFDFVFLTSVFTHMLPSETEHYVKEISRVLKPGGKCFLTFFLLNKESEELMSKSSFVFKYNMGNYALYTKQVDTANVAYKETYINKLIKENNLTITKTLYGKWPGRTTGLDFQDTLIIEKNKK